MTLSGVSTTTKEIEAIEVLRVIGALSLDLLKPWFHTSGSHMSR